MREWPSAVRLRADVGVPPKHQRGVSGVLAAWADRLFRIDVSRSGAEDKFSLGFGGRTEQRISKGSRAKRFRMGALGCEQSSRFRLESRISRDQPVDPIRRPDQAWLPAVGGTCLPTGIDPSRARSDARVRSSRRLLGSRDTQTTRECGLDRSPGAPPNALRQLSVWGSRVDNYSRCQGNSGTKQNGRGDWILTSDHFVSPKTQDIRARTHRNTPVHP